MPRGFHPSPQLFRIPEDAHADEETDEGDLVKPIVFSPIVWVAILRDACILVDIGEEDVPQVVVETAQGLLWDTESSDGWVEYDSDMMWKGLRYTESPFSFACVYNCRQLSNLECRRWIMEQVRWTATMREADPVWRNGDYHALQTLFAPLLQERLQSSADVSRNMDKDCDFNSPQTNATSRLPSTNLFEDTRSTEERENLDPSDDDDEIIDSGDQRTFIGDLFRNEGETERKIEGQNKSLQKKNHQSSYGVPSTPPRQPYGSPNLRKGSPTNKGTSPQTTEELVKRLARKQAELERRRQEERENRASPRRQVQRSPDNIQEASTTIKTGEIGSDMDSGSTTSATADDEEEFGSSSNDDPGDGAPWKCWFLPSLPNSKSGPLAP